MTGVAAQLRLVADHRAATVCRPPRARFANRRGALADVVHPAATAYLCDCGWWHLTLNPQQENPT